MYAKRKKMITGSLKAPLSMYGQNKKKMITGSLKVITGWLWSLQNFKTLKQL